MRQFTVYAIPRGQGRPRSGNGSIYKSAEDRAWERTIQRAYLTAYHDAEPIAGAVRVNIDAVLPVPASKPRRVQDDMMTGKLPAIKKPDVDNVAKAVMDALNRCAWLDDKQVIDLRVVKRYGHPARVVVMIREDEHEDY